MWIFRLHKGEEVFGYINEYQLLKRGRYCMNLATLQLFIYLFGRTQLLILLYLMLQISAVASC